jgi:hypothetical protein
MYRYTTEDRNARKDRDAGKKKWISKKALDFA